MELRIKPTEQFFMAGDVMVRMWQGTVIHEDGTEEEALAMVAMVGVAGQEEAMAEGLVSIPPPIPEDAARWARTVLSGQEIDPDD